MSKLTGKVAVVTGASKGIGAAIAKALAAEGASVVVNYASSKEGADKVVMEIVAKGGKAISVGGDVSQAAAIEQLFVETKKAYGKVDVLVNNAGVYDFSPLEGVTEAALQKMFGVNVFGLVLTTQAALKLFPAEGGSVINIGSAITSQTPPNTVVYTATKGAVDSITRVPVEGAGAAQNPCELDQSRRRRDRGRAFGGLHRQRLLQRARDADSARTHRAA